MAAGPVGRGGLRFVVPASAGRSVAMPERIGLVGPAEAGTTNKALPFAAALINKEPMHNTPFHDTWLQPLRLGPALFALLLATSCGTIHQPNRMTKIEEQNWGRTPDGAPVKLFTLT